MPAKKRKNKPGPKPKPKTGREGVWNLKDFPADEGEHRAAVIAGW